MNRPEVYHKSVQILYDAYFNDTLINGNCYACAVGNLVAGNLGLRFKNYEDVDREIHSLGWARIKNCYVLSDKGKGTQTWSDAIGQGEVSQASITPKIKKQIDATGYTAQELAGIEAAFEQCFWGETTEEEMMFNGLVAVLEALKEIHEVTDEDLIQSNHKRFQDHHERKLQTV